MEDLSSWAQIASTAGAVVVVVLFLRAWGEERTRQSKSEQLRAQSLHDIGSECHAHSTAREERLIAAVDRQAEVIDRNTEMMGGVKQVLSRLN